MRKRILLQIPDSRFQTAPPAWSSGTGTGTGDAINRLSPGDPLSLSPQIEACKGLLCLVSHAVNYTKFEWGIQFQFQLEPCRAHQWDHSRSRDSTWRLWSTPQLPDRDTWLLTPCTLLLKVVSIQERVSLTHATSSITYANNEWRLRALNCPSLPLSLQRPLLVLLLRLRLKCLANSSLVLKSGGNYNSQGELPNTPQWRIVSVQLVLSCTLIEAWDFSCTSNVAQIRLSYVILQQQIAVGRVMQ
jgi:hypothetical protein